MKFPEPFKRKRTSFYVFHYTDPVTGTRHQKSTKCQKKGEAREFVHHFMSELDKSRGSVKTFEEYSAPFFLPGMCPRALRLHGEGKNFGTRHMEKSRKWLDKEILQDSFSNLMMMDIRRRDVLDFRARLNALHPGRINTNNKVLMVVKTILSEAYFREDIPANPGSMVGEMKGDKKSRDILSIKEIKTLFSPGEHWPDLRSRACFMLAAYTGMRMSEVLALRWGKVDLASGVILIDTAWKNKGELGLPKWDKTRGIPIADKLKDILQDLKDENLRIADDDWVIGWEDGVPMGVTWWRKTFRDALLETGIYSREVQRRAKSTGKDGRTREYTYYRYFSSDGRKITPHCLRHSLNTYLLNAGADPLKVQVYLGWSNINIPVLTRVQAGYTHLREDMLREVANKIESLY